jgi:hypothetical protein
MFEDQINTAKTVIAMLAFMFAGVCFAMGYEQCKTLSPADVKACQNTCAPHGVQSVGIGVCKCQP